MLSRLCFAAALAMLSAGRPLMAEEPAWGPGLSGLFDYSYEEERYEEEDGAIQLLGGEAFAGDDEPPIVPIGGHPGYPVFPPCFCREWHPWYIGVEGGWAFGLNETPDATGVGAFFDGRAFGTQLHSGSNLSVRVGQRFSPRWRADFSWTNIHGDYNWRTSFFGGAEIAGFDSAATSNILLVNGFWHFFPPAERTSRLRLDPYAGVGIGVAFNTLANTAEFPDGNPAGQYATVYGDTTACFAARFALGTHLWITPNLAMEMSFATFFVGDYQTDDFRQIGGSVEQIGRYDFHNNWLGTAQLGLVWYPQPGFYRR